MGRRLAERCWNLALPPTEKVVLHYCCLVALNDGTNLYASHDRIAHETYLSKRTVGATLTKLEKRGVLVPTAYGKGGRGHPTNYTICLDAAPVLDPWNGNVADVATFPLNVADVATFPLNVADVATFSEENVATSAINVATSAINVATSAINVADVANNNRDITIGSNERENTHARVHARGPHHSLSDAEFDFAAKLWRQISPRLAHDAPPQQRHWLNGVELQPDTRQEGLVLIAPTEMARRMVETRWAKNVELKCQDISGSRLPVDTATADEYSAMLDEWMAAEAALKAAEA